MASSGRPSPSTPSTATIARRTASASPRLTPGAKATLRKTAKWYGRYTDGAGHKQRVPLSENKETARRMLAKLGGDAQLAGVGIVDHFAEHRQRSLLDHLEEFGRCSPRRGTWRSM